MLRLVLLVLYLIASSFASRQTEQGGLHPLGLTALPLASTADAGAGNDPDGASSPPPAAPTSDSGGGYDPNG